MSVIISKQLSVPFFKVASDYAIGESVFLNVNGASTEFLVVHQGNPDSSLYDASCEGTWLLAKDIYESRKWDNSNDDYKNSDIHAYLNGTFLGLFDSCVQSAIKQVKIPYWNGTGLSGSIASGTSGLSTKVFLLGGYEVGWTTSSYGSFPVDGACLDYFSGTAKEDSKRIGYYDGTAVKWWLRSAERGYTGTIMSVTATGYYNPPYCTESYGVRPALILPYDTKFNGNTNEFKG